ncbi:metallopeptidase family protein [Rhodovibrionaceae bacterium A322]
MTVDVRRKLSAVAVGDFGNETLIMAQASYMQPFGAPPSLADLEMMAREAMAEIPVSLRHYARELVVRVEDFPDEATMEELDLESPFDILGLYRGVNMLHQTSQHVPQDVNTIVIYRRPLLDYWCETGEDIRRLMVHVLIHEIGHHFGFSDRDMDQIEQQI